METKPTQDTERKDRRQETQCWREILSGALAYQYPNDLQFEQMIDHLERVK